MRKKQSVDLSDMESFMAKLSVDTLVMGHYRVGEYWKEKEFVPDYSKFYYILDGEGTVTIGSQTFYPKPGELWLFPAGVRQSYSVTDPKNTYLKYWVHFKAKVGETDLFSLIKTPFCVKIPHDRYLKNLFDQMISYYSENRGVTRQTMINTYMTQIICYYLEICIDLGLASGTDDGSKKMLELFDYMDNNLAGDITLKDLAGAVHLQENYFVRFFKKYTNTPPMLYLNEKRMKKAAQLLVTTDEKIGKIAAAVGFKDEAYFSRSFKKYFSVSPSDYREYKTVN